MRINDACIEQVGIKDTYIKNVIKSTNIPTDNKLYRDYLTCYYKGQRYQNEDGSINFSEISQFLELFYTPEEVETALKDCYKLKGQSDGETAVLTGKCVVKGLKRVETQREEKNLDNNELI